MKRIVDWINSHKIITICIALFLFVVQPIAVHWMFKTQAATPFWERTWEAGDLLGYIAGFEAFIGTVFLGAVAARQNDRANDLNERLIRIEEINNIFTRQPIIAISCTEVRKSSLAAIANELSMVYSKKEVCNDVYINSSKWQQEFYVFSLTVTNDSDFNISIKLKSLELSETFSDTFDIPYDINPIGLRANTEHMLPHASTSIGFILSEEDIEKSNAYNGLIKLDVVNKIGEEFVFGMKFVIGLSNEPKYMFVDGFRKLTRVTKN